jgi:hypothetical protein
MKPSLSYGMAPHATNRLRWLAASIGLAAAAYATYAGVTWYRYGTLTARRDEESDALLDGFMPAYEIVERHHIRVAAPAALTLAVAGELDLQASPIVRAMIRTRELVLGATPGDRPHVGGLLAEVEALGWGGRGSPT